MKIFKLKNARKAALLAFAALTVFVLFACKQKPTTPDDGTVTFCREFTKADVQQWADKKWTARNSPDFIRQLWFKVNRIGDELQIDVTPMKSYDQPIAGGRFGLTRETDCEERLSDKAEFSDNWIHMDSLHLIANDAGDLIDFSFVRLRPVQTTAPYVNYKVEVVLEKDGKETILYTAFTYPCPPHCPKPGDGGNGGDGGDGGNGGGTGDSTGVSNKMKP